MTLIWAVVVPGIAWADGNLANMAEQVTKEVEKLRTIISTQPNYPTIWTTLYTVYSDDLVCPFLKNMSYSYLTIQK